MTVKVFNLQEEIWELVRAGFPGIYIETTEAKEAIAELASLAQEHSLKLITWDLDSGLRYLGIEATRGEAADPMSALRALQNSTDSEGPTLLVLENFHRYLGSIEVTQCVLSQLHHGKQLGQHMVILAPELTLPKELERQFVVIEHPLPSGDELWGIAESLIDDPDVYPLAQRQSIQNAAAGMTRSEAESAFSLSLVRHNRIISEEVWRLKAETLTRSSCLELHRGNGDFDSLGGLESLKQFCFRSLNNLSENSAAKAKGVMLLGVPGTGKSAFVKALGAEVQRPVLALDVGRLLGSLVGQTEANIRRALQTADAMSPCILFIDEVEKALAGAGAKGAGDSGVASRLFGTILTWLNDHESDVYVVVTCNNIEGLPPEFSRAERFDGVIFLDLPTRTEKDVIWGMYRKYFQIGEDKQPADDLWTGAEIKACCRLSKLLGQTLKEAAELVVPVGVTAAEEVRKLRAWATGRCLSASYPGRFHANAVDLAGGPRRTINLEPSPN